MEPSVTELEERIARGEGKDLEFKRGLPRDAKTARTLCAFANTRGGLLLVGVGDRGEILGAPHPRATVEHLREIARFQLDPPLDVRIGTATIRGHVIVWCSVPISPARPHAALDTEGQGTVVVRAGSSNRAATGATLALIVSQRTGGKSLDPLQKSVLEWVVDVNRRARDPGGVATVAGFAQARNVGVQRARRAFTSLELAGRLVGHGRGARRIYAAV